MTDGLVHDLDRALGPSGLLVDAHDRARYETGWRYGAGRARCVARPASTAEVSETLRICGAHGARVVPQGANTGLVAASTPDGSGEMVVMSLERLDASVEIDPHDRVAVVDGGVLLSTLNARLAEQGLWFPVDLGADPQIGGMVATNTGGTRLLKYGDVRRNLLGLEVVLGDGRVLSMLDRLRKNNTGLDAKQLFVGTTGVFGVVTKAALSVAPAPAQTAAALVGCRSGDAALRLLCAVEQGLGDVLSAFEVMGRGALAAVLRHQPGLRAPFAPLPRFAALVELSTTLDTRALSLESVLHDRLSAHAATVGEEVSDVLVDDAAAFWGLRHRISESLRRDGEMVAFDVSVARAQLPAFTARVEALLAARFPHVRLCDYGHWGDGGSHLNLLWDPAEVADPAGRKRALQEEVYDLAVRSFGGSFSAEHGVGPHNQRYYDRYTDEPVKQLCGAIGAFCDPGDRLGTARLG
ncbi:MAG: FAD-binding oxidoreductase [Planctomycetota bacterium]